MKEKKFVISGQREAVNRLIVAAEDQLAKLLQDQFTVNRPGNNQSNQMLVSHSISLMKASDSKSLSVLNFDFSNVLHVCKRMTLPP